MADDIEMKPVISSNIEAAGYHAPSQTFRVRFKEGAMYQHPGVPQEVYDDFCKADSPGSHYHYNIKRFKGSKV